MHPACGVSLHLAGGAGTNGDGRGAVARATSVWPHVVLGGQSSRTLEAVGLEHGQLSFCS